MLPTVFEISKELDLRPAEVIELLKAYGIQAMDCMGKVSRQTADDLVKDQAEEQRA